MFDREKNKAILYTFLICAVCINAAVWTLSEKFIVNPQIAFFTNMAAALLIAFLFAKFLEKRMNDSADMLIRKIESIAAGDLTQRFQEDADDALPYGLSFRLGEMMKFFREHVGNLWRVSSSLIRQLEQFITMTREALEEFQNEVVQLKQVGNTLEKVREETLGLSYKVSDTRVSTHNHLHTMEQVSSKTKAGMASMKEHLDLPKSLITAFENIINLIESQARVLEDFKEISRTVSVLHLTLSEAAKESSLLKLNAAIDKAQTPDNTDNYRKLVEEVQLLMEKIGQLTQAGGSTSDYILNKTTSLTQRFAEARENLQQSRLKAEQVNTIFDKTNVRLLETTSGYQSVLDNIRILDKFMQEIDAKSVQYTDTIKNSTENFDRLNACIQGTLLKFGMLEEKIETIQKNLDQLAKFKNAFQIA